jgi:hypothetical protein
MSMKVPSLRLIFDGKEFSTPLVGGPSEALDLAGTALFGDLRPVAFVISFAIFVAASHIFGYGHIVPFG